MSYEQPRTKSSEIDYALHRVCTKFDAVCSRFGSVEDCTLGSCTALSERPPLEVFLPEPVRYLVPRSSIPTVSTAQLVAAYPMSVLPST
eukprot:285246-Rhodomonas_salina.1